MSEVLMIRDDFGKLVPFDSEAANELNKIPVGDTVRVTIKRARNIAFHRKMFALFKLAFDCWDAPTLEYKGQQVSKNFDRFRKDLTILAGHYTSSVNIKGEVRLDAQSLRFAKMSEGEFHDVYRSILSVVWSRVMQQAGYKSEEEVEKAVAELLRYE
jgi:hypothetical protein